MEKEIFNFDRQELTDHLSKEYGYRGFRARQLLSWLYKRRVSDFNLMTDVSREAREQLSADFSIYRPKLKEVQQSIDGTRKYLFELSDGELIESVLIFQPGRYTLCVSSQVGCAINCSFCRTALMGLRRNLGTHEILGQILAVQEDIEEIAEDEATAEAMQFNNIVFMGMGEPLQNFVNVVRALNILTDDLAFGFSKRRITVSNFWLGFCH